MFLFDFFCVIMVEKLEINQWVIKIIWILFAIASTITTLVFSYANTKNNIDMLEKDNIKQDIRIDNLEAIRSDLNRLDNKIEKQSSDIERIKKNLEK